VGRDLLERRGLATAWVLQKEVVYEEDQSVRALSPRLCLAQGTEENLMDVLRLYKWEIWKTEGSVLREGVGFNHETRPLSN
jgi:hypothetical protein